MFSSIYALCISNKNLTKRFLRWITKLVEELLVANLHGESHNAFRIHKSFTMTITMAMQKLDPLQEN